jgi:hypothetical protein
MPTTDFTQEIKPHLQHHHVVKQKATSDEVIAEIVKVINENVNTPFTKLVVDKLSYGNPSNDTFVKRVFDYACYAVKYRRDPNGREIIFTPKLLITIGKGDCKKFTTFIASVLKTKGIEPVLKVVSYSGQDWEHIYILYPKGDHYITVDPVNDEKFNKEVGHSHYRLYYLNGTKSKIMSNQLESMGSHNAHIEETTMMQGLGMSASSITNDLEHIGNFGVLGIGCPGMSDAEIEHAIKGLSGIGKKHPHFWKKLFNIAKKAGFVTQRATFLGLILLGKALEHSPLHLHLASKLVKLWEKDNGQHLSKIWSDFGGDPKVLQRTILKGMKTSGVHGMGATSSNVLDINDHTPIGQVDGINGIGVYTAAAAAGAITAALPIILKVMSAFKQHGIVTAKEGETADNVINAASDLHNEDGTHSVPLANNPIANAGANELGDYAANAVAAHTGGDAQQQYQNSNIPADHLPTTHGSMFNLHTPLAFNTWFKGTFLTFMYASITHEKIGVAAFAICATALVVTQSYNGIKFLIKNK